MGRHYNDTNIQCPFYKQEDEKMIYCEGVTDETAIHLAFTGSIKKYKEHYCSRRWENCLIAKMLWSKYD